MRLEVDIHKNFGNFQLDASFCTQSGAVTGLLGASGCGKSLTLKCIAGIERPDRGHIVLDGRVLFDSEQKINLPPQQRRVGYLFQNYALFPNMTVEQNIAVGVQDKAARKETVKQLISSFYLEGQERKYPRQLSGGQQQRVLIARALCATSSLLILDEPITGLDPTAIQEFYAMIRRLNREDKVAILMVSHDLRNAVEEANKILHLQKRVLFYGPAHDYMNSQAAGHFFHEKEQGRCKPTAGCHAVKLHMHKEEKS